MFSGVDFPESTRNTVAAERSFSQYDQVRSSGGLSVQIANPFAVNGSTVRSESLIPQVNGNSFSSASIGRNLASDPGIGVGASELIAHHSSSIALQQFFVLHGPQDSYTPVNIEITNRVVVDWNSIGSRNLSKGEVRVTSNLFQKDSDPFQPVNRNK